MNSSSASDLPHGRSRYTNAKCRCEVCRADWNAYMASYRTANRHYLNAMRRARRRSARMRQRGQTHDFADLLAAELDRES